jgi:hypothetical protein
MQRRYRVDEIEIFWVLWVAVVGSPGTPYCELIELHAVLLVSDDQHAVREGGFQLP